jgi:hypothetical protein
MSSHTFNDTAHRLKERDFLRKILPDGPNGVSIEDLDVVLRMFTKSNPVGSYRLIENKTGSRRPAGQIGASKDHTFGIQDFLARQSDPKLHFYKGYFVINTATDDWENCEEFIVNCVSLTKGQFVRWIWGDLLNDWLLPEKEGTEGYRLAFEASLYELVEIKPYTFPTYVVSKIKVAFGYAYPEARNGR